MDTTNTLFNKTTRTPLWTALALLVALATLPACSGDQGPTGPKGPKGTQGPKGEVGPAGDDGSVMLAGKGKPEKSMGNEGDFYLDQKTGELYGPKNDKGWGSPISLQGAPGKDGQDGKDGADGNDGNDGQDGKDGSQIYSGTSAPKASMGKTGDFYLNTKTFDLYGPKDPKKKNNWGTPINLKGTANVLYSNWIKPKKWKEGTSFGDKFRYFDIAANAMTQDILDKGIVNIYADFANAAPVYQLPVGPKTAPGFGLSNYFTLKPQNIRIGYFDADNPGTDPGTIPLDNKFRYVIIPGGNQVSGANLKNMPYQEVKKRFGIRN